MHMYHRNQSQKRVTAKKNDGLRFVLHMKEVQDRLDLLSEFTHQANSHNKKSNTLNDQMSEAFLSLFFLFLLLLQDKTK